MKNVETPITIFRPGEKPWQGSVHLPAKPTLAQLHRVLAPTFAPALTEHVHVLHDGKPADLFVDEWGVNKGLRRNAEATVIYRAAWMSAHPEANPETLPWIAGPAVLFHRKVWF